ncbi:hypothetical protein SteCoe_8592 [Stentor coeruleus]|uniref:Uncharacterized protein n=1 Tax=Stentor coeruleus TaxID=5963 RepID=A0A1R2CK17_9CILI|nr:hypothetical protein SteCoe_8592 [Stentor coeruleus]
MSFSSFPFEIAQTNEDSRGLNVDELIRENQELKDEIAALRSEKVLNSSYQNREKEQLRNNLKELQQRLVGERQFFRKEIMELTKQLDGLKRSVDRMIEIRMQIRDKNKEKIHEHRECLRKSSQQVYIQERGVGDFKNGIREFEDME